MAARPEDDPRAVASIALEVALGYLAAAGLCRILACEHLLGRPDPIGTRMAELIDTDGVPRSLVLCAGWRAALGAIADGTSASAARAAFAILGIQPPTGSPGVARLP